MIHDSTNTLEDMPRLAARTAQVLKAAGYLDVVCPGDVSGAVMAGALASYGFNVSVVRMHPVSCFNHNRHVIGDVRGKKLVYVDDQISYGRTLGKVRDAVAGEGGEIAATYEYQFDQYTARTGALV